MKLARVPLFLFALTVPLAPAVVRADEAADARKAEIARKKEEARKKAQDKAAADKAAADAKVAADKAAADAKAAADKAAADAKAAADKAGTGGATGTGGAATTATGGAGGKAGSGGAGGAGGKSGAGGAASTSTKVEEKDAPLPAGDIETLRKDRSDRRKSTVERLRRRWGSLLANDKGAADLKLHSRRVAFLQRIRVVAEAKKDKKTIEAVDELLTAEDDRHSKAMNSLREGALSAGGAK